MSKGSWALMRQPPNGKGTAYYLHEYNGLLYFYKVGDWEKVSFNDMTIDRVADLVGYHVTRISDPRIPDELKVSEYL